MSRYADEANAFDSKRHSTFDNVDNETPMYAVFLQRGGVYPVMHKIDKMMDSFLEEQHAEDNSKPENLAALEQALCVKLITGGVWDPMSVGVVNWSRAFYIAAADVKAVRNFLLFVDAFITWRVKT